MKPFELPNLSTSRNGHTHHVLGRPRRPTSGLDCARDRRGAHAPEHGNLRQVKSCVEEKHLRPRKAKGQAGGGHAPRTTGHHFCPVRATPARAVPADWCRREDDPSTSPSLTAVAHPDLPRRPWANASVLVMTSLSRRKPALGRERDHPLPSSHRTPRGGQVLRPMVRGPPSVVRNRWGCREPLLS